MVDQHRDAFKDVGKLKDFQVTLHIDPTIALVVQPIRRIPYHTRKKVDAELDRLEMTVLNKFPDRLSGLTRLKKCPRKTERFDCVSTRDVQMTP